MTGRFWRVLGVLTFIILGVTVVNSLAAGPDGSVDPTFNPAGAGADGVVLGLTVQNNGKILVGGKFDNYNGTTAPRLARLNPDGSLDPTFSHGGAGINTIIHGMVIQDDGKILVNGSAVIDGRNFPFITRLFANGFLDADFLLAGSASGTAIHTTALQSDGKILVGGDFTNYRGSGRDRLARLNPDGSVDLTFNSGTGPDDAVYSLVIQNDGKILVGGLFFNYNGLPAPIIIRLNSDGSLDPTFNPHFGGGYAAYNMVMQSDGKLLAVGSFANSSRTAFYRVARFNQDGSFDSTFSPGGNSVGWFEFILSLVLQPNGQILIGGDFTSYNGME